MMKYRLTSSLFLALIFSTTAHSALDRIIDFAVLDEMGVFHQLSRYQHKHAVVLMTLDQACQSMPAMFAEYDDIISEFSSNGIEFLLIDSEGLGRETLASLRLNLPILEDSGQLVSESLGFENSGEVLMLNPERLSVYFRGPVSSDLRTSLNSMESIQILLSSNPGAAKSSIPTRWHMSLTPQITRRTLRQS